MTQLFLPSILFVSSLFLTSISWAVPEQVLIIRHAEKLNDVDVGLSEKGRQRASALVSFFTKNSSVIEFGPPVAIFAAAPKDEKGSQRSILTATPLAESLGMTVRKDFHRDDVMEIVREILNNSDYAKKTVLIVWARSKLPELAEEFGAGNVPKKWNEAVFDRVWKIKFKNDQPGDLIDLPQDVLPGDSK